MRRQRRALSDEELEQMVQEALAKEMTIESAIQRTLESLGGDQDYLRYRMRNPHLKTRPFNQIIAEDALAIALLVWSMKQSREKDAAPE